jgi:Flp pilus assembly protein TadG
MAPGRLVLSGDRGAVTVEAALALCSLVLVLALAVAAVSAAGAQLRCMDAARETARLVARGEPERARQVGELIAPGGARTEIRVVGDEVSVEVSSDIVGLPGLTVSARAVGVLEPGVLGGALDGGSSVEGGAR